jgi:uncharacterized OB-fold protein
MFKSNLIGWSISCLGRANGHSGEIELSESQRLKPELYGSDQPPALLGGVCACGYVFFPLQSYGCERCGRFGEDLQPKDLAGRGRLIASTVVHLHAADRRTPFVVGAIALDDGPVVRTLLTGTPTGLAAGTRMESALIAIEPGATESGDATARVDLRFTAAPQGE